MVYPWDLAVVTKLETVYWKKEEPTATENLLGKFWRIYPIFWGVKKMFPVGGKNLTNSH